MNAGLEKLYLCVVIFGSILCFACSSESNAIGSNLVDKSIDYSVDLVNQYLIEGEFEEAIEEMEIVTEVYPESANARGWLGTVLLKSYLHNGRRPQIWLDRSIFELRRAIKLDPVKEWYLNLSVALAETSDYDLSIHMLRRGYDFNVPHELWDDEFHRSYRFYLSLMIRAGYGTEALLRQKELGFDKLANESIYASYVYLLSAVDPPAVDRVLKSLDEESYSGSTLRAASCTGLYAGGFVAEACYCFKLVLISFPSELSNWAQAALAEAASEFPLVKNCHVDFN